MSIKNEVTNSLISYFNNHNIITREDLFTFFSQYYHELKETTFRWYIHDLKKNGTLYSPQRGLFELSFSKSAYQPYIYEQILIINNIVNQEFNNMAYCLWSTDWFNEFSIHQTSKFSIIVEVEKDLVNNIFYKLQDKGIKDVFINPDSNIFDNYISDKDITVIVKPLVTKSPLQKYKNIMIPKIEKLLVDLFCEKYILMAYQGYEMKTIFKNVINTYNLNYSTLFNYAKRRKKEDGLKQYLHKEGIIKDELL